MKVVVFGATGMVGSGVLQSCLEDARVERVASVGRSPARVTHAKLHEVVVPDLFDLAEAFGELLDCDACFFCAGVSAAGMSESDYHGLTYDLTIAVARAVLAVSPNVVFCYVSGAGTDSSEKGRFMWARVKGKTENALLRVGFKEAYMFRPGYIQPMGGVRSRTPQYRIFYALMAPLYPLLRRIAPNQMTTSRVLGRAMVEVAARGYPRPLLEVRDINALGVEG